MLFFTFKTELLRADETAQWLATLFTLAEDLGFGSQHPYNSSQPPRTTVPEDLVSSDLHRHQAYTMCRQNTHA